MRGGQGARLGRGGGLDTKRTREISGLVETPCHDLVLVTQLYTFVKTKGTVHLHNV